MEAATIVSLSAVLLALLLLLASILFQFRWAIPFVPTPTPVVQTMIHLARLRPGETVIDLGAGDARFLLQAKRHCSGIHAIGYEGALVVWMLGILRILCSHHRDVRFYCRNFFRAHFGDADVIFLYLSMHVMRMLVPKFRRELKPGTRIVSHAFQLPGLTPDAIQRVPMRYGGSVNVYSYVWR